MAQESTAVGQQTQDRGSHEDWLLLEVRRSRLNQRRKAKLTWDVIAKRLHSTGSAISKARNPNEYGTNAELYDKAERYIERLEKEQSERFAGAETV